MSAGHRPRTTAAQDTGAGAPRPDGDEAFRPDGEEASGPNGENVVVIGGGIAGLASAALLAREGYTVDLVEARESFGGRAGSWEHEGFRFDTGPSWYLMPDVFDHFFRLLGTTAEAELDLQQLDPAYRVFFEGSEGDQGDRPEPLDIAADQDTNIARFEAVQPGAGRALARYLDSAQRTYDMAIERFLYTSFTSIRPFLSRSVAGQAHRLGPLLLQSLERFVARRFTDPRIRQVLGYPAVFLGSSPDRTPGMYHLMSALDLTGGVLYPQGGFGRLMDVMVRLARESGVRLHAGTAATAILTEPVHGAHPAPRDHRARRARGRRLPARAIGVRVRGRDGEERELPAGVVVSAADLHHTETALLPRPLQTFPEEWWRRRTSGPGGVLVMLGVRGALPEMPHHSLFFTRDWKANFSAIAAGTVPEPASVYVCKPSATDPGVAPEGHENLFVLVPMPADPGLGRGGLDGSGDPVIESIADAALEQVARWAGIPDLAERIVVRRTVGPTDFAEDLGTWRGGILGPAHTLAQSAFFRAGNVSRRVEGLYYAGSSTIPGIGLPMCLISAEILLKRLRGDHSAAPLPEPESSPAKLPAPWSASERSAAPLTTPGRP
ncbi:phytoene desaturase family protein [Citricoccus sp. K5]|uniref:phytoene desaturase family protein n=1 Tax=Citricoccus sp. K5 TaxID=2653135 RepID=UPI0012F155AC|nr:phytoene desaturase family protein [Citricoccus sp. K5]VXC07489.1 Phytoene desaturase [Citricoccus sp. K5]